MSYSDYLLVLLSTATLLFNSILFIVLIQQVSEDKCNPLIVQISTYFFYKYVTKDIWNLMKLIIQFKNDED